MVGEIKIVGLMVSFVLSLNKEICVKFVSDEGIVGFMVCEWCFENNLIMCYVGDCMIIVLFLVIIKDEVDELILCVCKLFDEVYEKVVVEGLFEVV